MTHTLWPIGARLEKVVALAAERGLAIEDPRTFHAAFPGLNLPGEAFGVLHGQLPGNAAQRPAAVLRRAPDGPPRRVQGVPHEPRRRRRLRRRGPGSGPSHAAGTAPEGEVDGDLRVAVADGVLTAWRLRPRWQADGDAFDALARDVAGVVTRRGL